MKRTFKKNLYKILILSILCIFSQNIFCMEEEDKATEDLSSNTTANFSTEKLAEPAQYKLEYEDQNFFKLLDFHFANRKRFDPLTDGILFTIQNHLISKTKKAIQLNNYDDLLKFIEITLNYINRKLEGNEKHFESAKEIILSNSYELVELDDPQLIDKLHQAKYFKFKNGEKFNIDAYYSAIKTSARMAQFFFMIHDKEIDDKFLLMEQLFEFISWNIIVNRDMPEYKGSLQFEIWVYLKFSEDFLNKFNSKYRFNKLANFDLNTITRCAHESLYKLKANIDDKEEMLYFKLFLKILNKKFKIDAMPNILMVGLVTSAEDNEDNIIKIYNLILEGLDCYSHPKKISENCIVILFKNSAKFNKRNFLQTITKNSNKKFLRAIIDQIRYKRYTYYSICCVPYTHTIENELSQNERDCLDLIDPDKIVQNMAQRPEAHTMGKLEVSDSPKKAPSETDPLIKH